MTHENWWDEDGVMAHVASALRSISVPDAVLGDAQAAFGHRRRAGTGLAFIAYDSALDDAPTMRAAGAEGRRILSFDAGAVSVEIEVSAGRLTGQLVPPTEAAVELVSALGVIGRTRADEMGCFVLDRPPPGPVQFRCRTLPRDQEAVAAGPGADSGDGRGGLRGGDTGADTDAAADPGTGDSAPDVVTDWVLL